MGASWQTPAQKIFIDNHFPSYLTHLEDGKKDDFWHDFADKWFESWPLPEPTPELIGEGTAEKAKKAERAKMVAKLKRVFKTAEDDCATGGRQNLNLSKNAPRKRSEVQVYMSMFYDDRIREVVKERWAKANLPSIDSSRSHIPEDQVDSEDSSLLKDTKIPLHFKNLVAQELYEAEEEDIKKSVRSKRDAAMFDATVYNTSGEERVELVRAYQKNISVLGKNLVNVLKNAERKCAAKGIIWLACPTATAGGKPVGHFHCIGASPDGQDFESFVGAEKAKEIKSLFSSWIYTVYPASDWPLFTLDGEDAATTTDGAACDPTGVTVTCKLSSSPAQPSTPSNQSATLRNPSAIPPDPSTILPNQSTAPPSEAAAPSDQSHVTPIIPDSTPHQVDPSPSTPSFVANQPGVADDRDSETPAQPNTDTDISSDSSGTAPPPSPVSRAVSAASVSSRSNLLAGVRDEPGWMQKKGTLNYFRNTFKLGNLADVIRHWYELERLLGFQKVTPSGFPTKRRPVVVNLFYKNAHKYDKDFGIETHTLGRQIMAWWTEICPPGEEPNVRFGGPTGISTLVVLLSWWCSQLRVKPSRERDDCLRTLKDVDRVFLATIDDLKNPSATLPMLSSSTLSPRSQRRKRAAAGGTSPQKRRRVR